MGEDREQRHICKFCKKSFPCGRSLGGHMRSHMIMNSTATDEKLSKRKATSVNGGSNCNGFMGFEAGGHAGYGLRENPKKTWRLSDSNDATVRQGKTCKECGKAFPSWKALFGHMRCHSEKERVFNNLKEDSWTLENQKLVMDSQSDNEAAAPKGRRRSRRMRYRTTTPTPTFSFANASSSVSEIDQEPEEVAMCLMMLSRDVGQWGGLNSVAESSDNNYIVKEARGRSSGLDKQIREEGIREFIRDGDEIVKKKKNKPSDRKLESVVSNSENVLFEKKICEFHGSDSGFFRDGVKKVESEVSVDGIHWDDEPKKFKLDDEAGFDVSDVELGRPSFNNNRHNGKGSTLDYSEAELGKNLIKEVGMDGTDSKFGKYNSSKRSRNDGYDHESGGDSNKKIRYDASESEICRDNQKRSRYECTTCNKIFHSYQALGGHRASHKKVKGCFASTIDCSENSIETDVSPDPTADSKLIKSCSNEKPVGLDRAGSAETCHGSKKSKGHECPICFKVFASGQALGGHKRSHLVGGSESRGNQTIVIQHQLPEIRDLLDLNLPAPIEEETGGCMGFNSCWVGSNHTHEPLVGLISN